MTEYQQLRQQVQELSGKVSALHEAVNELSLSVPTRDRVWAGYRVDIGHAAHKIDLALHFLNRVTNNPPKENHNG